MKIVVTQDATAAAVAAADMLRATIAGKAGRAPVLGLATGRTMEAVYAVLLAREAHAPVGLARCTTFNLDEYCDLSPADPQSYASYMQTHLFRPAGMTDTHVPDGAAADIGAACAAYEAAIVAAGGIDIQLLGIGDTGHIGFNEPLSSFASRTRRVRLDVRTRAQNAAMFEHRGGDVPEYAVTMGIATIMDARRIVLMATGAAKAAVIARAVEGPLTAMVPATALHLHPDVTVVLDEEAAASLTAGF